MKRLAYFVNQYPATSQTFIRREIGAVEALGRPVIRYAVRGWTGTLVDPADRDEQARTRRILDLGLPNIGLRALATALRRPGRFLRALRTAWKLGKVSIRGRAVHLIYLAEACVLLRWSQADAIDHIHAHFGTNSAAVALLCRQLGGPPFSFTVHGPDEFDQPISLALGDKIAGSAFVVAISRYGRSQLWRWADPADWAKVTIIHCGLGPDYIDAQLSPSPDVPRLLNIGRLAEQKGQMALVEAAALLRDRGRSFEVAIIGGGPLEDDLRRKIADLRLDSVVKLLGWKSNTEIRQELLASRALVLPSFAEGLPVVIMEALALGRPVLSTYVAGIPELVRPGESGWLVPAGTIDELADAMTTVLDTPPAELERMGRAGRARVVLEHDARREAARLIERIDQTVAPE